MSDVLRPEAAGALEAWRRRVSANREQAERLRESTPPRDFYAAVAPTSARIRAARTSRRSTCCARWRSRVRRGSTSAPAAGVTHCPWRSRQERHRRRAVGGHAERAAGRYGRARDREHRDRSVPISDARRPDVPTSRSCRTSATTSRRSAPFSTRSRPRRGGSAWPCSCRLRLPIWPSRSGHRSTGRRAFAARAQRVPRIAAGPPAPLRAAPVRARSADARRARGTAAVALSAALRHARYREGAAPRRAGARRGHEPRWALGAIVGAGASRDRHRGTRATRRPGGRHARSAGPHEHRAALEDPWAAEPAHLRLHDLSRAAAARQRRSLRRGGRAPDVRGGAHPRRRLPRPAGRVLRSDDPACAS